MLRFTLFAFLSLAAAPALSQTPPMPVVETAQADVPAPAPRPGTVRVSFQTSEGPILLELEAERAPVTTANFLRYVDQKRFDGIAFYRAVKVAPGYGLVQGGLRNDPKRILKPIAHEPTTQTGLTHADGTISMARAEPGSANADFFIAVGAMSSMDAQPGQPGDNLGFAAFGRVIEGMDIVRRILDSPTDPNAGGAAMKGQMLIEPVKIVAARRAE